MGRYRQALQLVQQHRKASRSSGEIARFNHLALVGLEHTKTAGLAPDINPYHIGERGGIYRRRRGGCLIHGHTSHLTAAGQVTKKDNISSNRNTDQPGRASTHTGSAVSPLLRMPEQAAATSLIAASCSGGRGTVFFRWSPAHTGTGHKVPTRVLPLLPSV